VIKGTKLSKKQKLFAEEYVKCGVATRAYAAAGYSTKGKDWMTNAKELPKNPHIAAYIEKLNEEVRPHSKAIADIAEMQERLTEIVRQLASEEVILSTGQRLSKSPALREVTKAAELLLRTQGAFLDRSQVEVSGAIPVVIRDDL
jgi:phage terminase small subunit